MNFGINAGLPASFAGIPVAQTGGSDVDRAHSETAAQRRASANDVKAEKAAGIGETDGNDHEADERDADGRRPWEPGHPARKSPAVEANSAADDRQSRDATGASGGQLDLTG